jgi:protein tyrosine/serine phosphatase
MNTTSRRRASALPGTVKLRPWIVLFALLLVFGNAPFARAANRKNAESAAKASPAKAPIVGIDNFGQVDAHLFRGAQPEPTAYAELKTLGIDTVVRFNPEGQDIATEKNQVESLGMKFVSLPWSGLGEPTHEQVVSFFALLRDNPDAKIFVHCRLGADRTGVMVALYRLTFSYWTADQALAEMHEFHYHHMLLPHLQRYVQSFASAMASDKDLLNFDPPIASLSH